MKKLTTRAAIIEAAAKIQAADRSLATQACAFQAAIDLDGGSWAGGFSGGARPHLSYVNRTSEFLYESKNRTRARIAFYAAIAARAAVLAND